MAGAPRRPLAGPTLRSAPLRNAPHRPGPQEAAARPAEVCVRRPPPRHGGDPEARRPAAQGLSGSRRLTSQAQGLRPGGQSLPRRHGGTRCAGLDRIRAKSKGETGQKQMAWTDSPKRHQRGGDLGKRRHKLGAGPRDGEPREARRGAGTAAAAWSPELRAAPTGQGKRGGRSDRDAVGRGQPSQ